MEKKGTLEKRVAAEYLRRLHGKKAPPHEEGPCCEIVTERALSRHKRGLYHMALTNRVNRAVLERLVDDSLRAPVQLRRAS